MLKPLTKTYPCIKLPFFIINRNELTNKMKEFTIICSINEKEEAEIDMKHSLTLLRGNATFHLSYSNVVVYGNVDFNTNSLDYKHIHDHCKLITNGVMEGGIRLPANYDYDSHTVKSDTGRAQYYETWDSAKVVQYGHGCIGKPAKVVIFKYKVIA